MIDPIVAYFMQINTYNFTGEVIIMAKWYYAFIGSFFFVYIGESWTVLE